MPNTKVLGGWYPLILFAVWKVAQGGRKVVGFTDQMPGPLGAPKGWQMSVRNQQTHRCLVCRVRHVFLRVSIYHGIGILQVPGPASEDWGKRVCPVMEASWSATETRAVGENERSEWQRRSGMASRGSICPGEKATLPRQSTANAWGDVQKPSQAGLVGRVRNMGRQRDKVLYPL